MVLRRGVYGGLRRALSSGPLKLRPPIVQCKFSVLASSPSPLQPPVSPRTDTLEKERGRNRPLLRCAFRGGDGYHRGVRGLKNNEMRLRGAVSTAATLHVCKRAANQNVLYRTIQDDTGRHQTESQPVQDSTGQHRMIQDSTNSTVLENR